jgi:cell shape-determining protein MreD
LIFPFVFTLLACFAIPLWFPYLPLTYFPPLLALSCMKYSRKKATWINAIAGIACDLLSTQSPFGAQTAIFILATALLYRQRDHLYLHKRFSLPFFTYLFSITTISMKLVLFFGQEGFHAFSWKGITIQLLLMPLCDALYAFLWFRWFLPKKQENVAKW